jgi:hypothetical protein
MILEDDTRTYMCYVIKGQYITDKLIYIKTDQQPSKTQLYKDKLTSYMF